MDNIMENQEYNKENITNIMTHMNQHIKNQDFNNAMIFKDEFRGVICDTQGFSQHYGDCWNDSFNEILFFSDKIKDITQPLFYNLDTSYDFLYKLIHKKIFNNATLSDAKMKIVDKIIKYINVIKIRFVNHYNMLLFDQTKKKSNTEYHEMLQKKRRYSSLCGVSSAKYGVEIYEGNKGNYVPGLSLRHFIDFFAVIFKLFDIPYSIELYRQCFNLTDIPAILISSSSYEYKSDGLYTVRNGMHSTSMFRCNKQWKFYDDNNVYELIDIDKDAIKQFVTQPTIAFGIDDRGNLWFMKYKVNKMIKEDGKDRDAKIIKITHYYYHGAWNDWSIEWQKKNNIDTLETKYKLQVIKPDIRITNVRYTIKKGGKRNNHTRHAHRTS